MLVQLRLVQLKENLWEGSVDGTPESLVRASTKEEARLLLKVAMLHLAADKMLTKEWREPSAIWFTEV